MVRREYDPASPLADGIGTGSVTFKDDGLGDMRYLVRLSVPRAGGWRAWGTIRYEFGRQLAEQESAAVALHVDSEIRRGRDYVRVIIVATVDAADVAEALDLAWWTFRKAAGEDLAGWDLARAAAEVRPEAPLGTVRLLRGWDRNTSERGHGVLALD
jgi:hypothetical protein